MAPNIGKPSPQISRRTILTGAGAAAAAISLAACGGNKGITAPTTTSSSAGAPGTTTSTSTTAGSSAPNVAGDVTMWANHSAAWEKDLRAAIATYQGKTAGAKIDLLNIADGEQFNTKLKTSAIAKTLPSMFYVRSFEIAGQVKDGWLMALDDEITKFGDKVHRKDFYPAVESQFGVDGKLYGIPEDMSAYGIYVNHKLFQEKGIKIPTADWTWDDFYKLAEEFVVKNGNRQTRWGAFVNPSAWAQYGVMKSNGGELFSEDGSKCVLDSDANYETFNKLAKSVASGATGTTTSLPSGVDVFVSGMVAMFMNGSWYNTGAKDAIKDKFEWSILPLPKGTTGKRELATAGGGWALSRDVKNKDAAFGFLEYLTSPEGQATIPYLKFRPMAPRTTDKIEDTGFPEIGHDAAAISYPALWTKYEQAYGQRYESLFNGKDPRAALKQIQDETNA